MSVWDPSWKCWFCPFNLDRESPASEKTALEAVMAADEERVKLEALADELATREDNESQDYLMSVGYQWEGRNYLISLG